MTPELWLIVYYGLGIQFVNAVDRSQGSLSRTGYLVMLGLWFPMLVVGTLMLVNRMQRHD